MNRTHIELLIDNRTFYSTLTFSWPHVSGFSVMNSVSGNRYKILLHLWKGFCTVKASLKRQLSKVKLPTVILKPTFFFEGRGKWMFEIWKHDYPSEITSNDVFYFSINIIRFEFQPMDFLGCDFFARFVRISRPNRSFPCHYRRKFRSCTEKQKMSFDFLL